MFAYPTPLAQASRVAVTLTVGLVGGAIFYALKMPLAWMTGAMVICAVLALSGVKLHNPARLRNVMFSVLGVLLGTVFTSDVLTDLSRWSVTAICMIGFVAVVTVSIAYGLVRFGGHDRNTAFFAAAPGGLTEMTILSEAYGGDVRVVALFHATRIFLTVVLFVLTFKLLSGYTPPTITGTAVRGFGGWWNFLAIGACAVAGYLVGKLLRLPAPEFLGPALLSAVVHLSGLAEAVPGPWLVAIAQVVLGTSVGCRFVGYSFRETRVVLGKAALATVLTLIIATGCAYALWTVTGQPFEALWLAFAPGGMTEMILISIAVDVEADFVSIMHVLRWLFIMVLATLGFRWWHALNRQQ